MSPHTETGIQIKITEAKRTPDFREGRSRVVEGIKSIFDGYVLGESRVTGNFRVGKTPAGSNTLRVNDKTERDRTERTLVFDEEAYKFYEQGEAYDVAGQTDVVASFEEVTFNEDTRQFERLGWEIRGDGSVQRLTGEINEQGQMVHVAKPTNDVLDLQNAQAYLKQVHGQVMRPDAGEQ